MTVAKGSACPRWYAYTRRIYGGAVTLVNALHSGFWIGVLRDKTFQTFDVHPHQLGMSHDRRYSTRAELEPWEQACLDNHYRKGNSILMIAGDGGREVAAMLKSEIEVDAVDFSQEMIENANTLLAEKGYPDRVALAPRYELPASTKDYNGIWIGREFLSTIHGRSRRIEFFEQLREHANARTTLHCSFFIRRGNGLEWRLNQWLGNIGRFLTRNPSTPVELGDHLDPEVPMYHHHFLKTEVRDELQQAGWQLGEYTTDWFGYAMATPLPALTHSEPSPSLQHQT